MRVLTNRLRAMLATAFALLLACTALPMPAVARDLVDLDRMCSLIIQVPSDVRTELSLYRVADVSRSGDEYALSGDFASYPVEVPKGDDADWDSFAQTLAGLAGRDALKPTAVMDVSGSRARATNLSVGLYLGVMKGSSNASARYEFQPFIVQLPTLGQDQGQDVWVYDGVATSPKHSDTALDTIHAVKVWKDGGAAEKESSSRPQSISVDLLCDGVVAKSATLSEQNSWRATFGGLEPGHSWTVAESEVPTGYTVSVDRRGATFVVTNSAQDGSDQSLGNKLPQTSMLWWPVPVLLLLGAVLLVSGYARRGSE